MNVNVINGVLNDTVAADKTWENHEMTLFTQYKVKLSNECKIQDLINDGIIYNEDIIYITIKES